MIKNKWTTSVFDTTANLYAGISSQNANKEDESLKYYEKLADMKLKAKDYEHIYVFLPQYYTKKKDEVNFKKYLNLGKQVYPEKTFWNDMEFEYITSNLLLAEITKKFDGDFTANKLTSETAMDYGNFFFNESIKGFHNYDLNISFECIQKGYKIIATKEILIEHYSNGTINDSWYKSAYKIHQLYKKILPLITDDIKKYNISELEFKNGSAFLPPLINSGNLITSFKIWVELFKLKPMKMFSVRLALIRTMPTRNLI